MAINMTDYTGSLATYGIIAIPVFSGWYQEQSNAELAELISKSVFFTIYLINQFTTIIEQANQLSLVSGFSIRVGELLDRLKKIEKEREEEEIAPLSQELHSITSSNQADNLGVVLSLREVSIYSPDNRLLVNRLTMDISVDSNTIIMGPSGCGKSALVKTIAGIWPHKEGVVSTWKPLQPPHAIFVPQTPYLSSGSFVDQVIYPLRSTEGGVNRDKVVTSITAANLTHLLDRFGTDEYVSLPSWNELSPGEKQKIYFARLFYHQPNLAVLDEATSSMDEDTETQLYQTCLDLGVTLLSTGHRSSLKKFHKNILSISRGGSWSLQHLY
eukprot:TRINITY_DN2906_c0_g1_i1.p1 TRINITY_DN2906_c0_g1~~TRINITY_DN2906_c0_g1_i1.p1  ORF type:complete len:328 (-),score=57.15 TRINITY_DN2906_c0_g1_i1:311-1294(-)